MISLELDTADGAHGDRLNDLYVRHHPWALGLAYLLVGDRQQAEDLAQEAFLRLTGRFQHILRPEAVPAYLRRTIVNLHFSGLRRRRLERAESLRTQVIESGSAIPDVPLQTDLWRSLLRLPSRQRAALVLRYYEDLSEREAAEVLRCSVPALKSLVARGMDALRREVEEDIDV